MLGPLWYSWPSNTRIFEFLILDRDEQSQSLDEGFRQKQLRMALPHAIAAMREPGEEVVIRLDGPLTADELLPALVHLTEPDLTGRFCISDACKVDAAPVEIIGSVRIQPSPQTCSEICLDPKLGLQRSVRSARVQRSRGMGGAVADNKGHRRSALAGNSSSRGVCVKHDQRIAGSAIDNPPLGCPRSEVPADATINDGCPIGSARQQLPLTVGQVIAILCQEPCSDPQANAQADVDEPGCPALNCLKHPPISQHHRSRPNATGKRYHHQV